MKITWLGHSGFRIEIGDQILLVDPWMTGNPMFPEDSRETAIKGATAIVLTHGHGDHVGDTIAVAKELNIPVLGIYDLMSHFEKTEGIAVTGFNKGGTVKLGTVAITMVNAVHSSSMHGPNGPVYCGSEAGYMIAGDGHTIYVSGDTDVMADMKIFNDLHKPDIGILCSGGHFTMDMKRASYAAKTFFNFAAVIPCHYRTFPLLEQSAALMKEELQGVNVIEPQVMVPITM
ncbi:metal-dependent hydrolase [Thalassovita sp.]|uniref:metal-dependent hydrolase n=1 Tax=Thalassovita sp. TaxID=1979401 RepID=UPI0029DE5AC0|nr:metal-dependent hydrolase [Thalassovita sp.]